MTTRRLLKPSISSPVAPRDLARDLLLPPIPPRPPWGGRQEVQAVSQTGRWYRSGRGLAPVRWVFVHDRTKTHQGNGFLTINEMMTARRMTETGAGREGLEMTIR